MNKLNVLIFLFYSADDCTNTAAILVALIKGGYIFSKSDLRYLKHWSVGNNVQDLKSCQLHLQFVIGYLFYVQKFISENPPSNKTCSKALFNKAYLLIGKFVFIYLQDY